MMRPAWIEVSTSALKKNLANLRACVAPNVEFMAVIKADAYGHGAIKIGELYKKQGVSRFAIVLIQEGIELRKNGFEEPILIIGNTLVEDFKELLEYDLTPTIYKYSQAEALSRLAVKAGKSIKIHIEIDTGMGRLGFMPTSQSNEQICKIAKLPYVSIEGIYTHLPAADQPSKPEYTMMQFEKFKTIVEELRKNGVDIPIKHICNSAATINYPEMHMDMVRPGTSLYGFYPSPEMKVQQRIELFPALSIKAKLAHVKQVPIGTRVSYSGTFQAKRATVLGVVPLGYVDGVFRQMANRGNVLLKGQRCPIVGNICMDQFMIDVTDVDNPEVGDEVVVIGNQGEEQITADEVGALVGTISIEVITRLGKRMPVCYVE